MTRPLSVAVAGLGTVGGGVLKLLRANADIIAARAGRPIAVTAVSARDRNRDRGLELGGLRLYEDPVALANDAAVDVVVEAMGGSEGPARALVETALAAGKPVVTANKALLAIHGAELAALAEWPCLTVCEPGLGALHHTRTTAHFLVSRGARLAGFAMSQSHPDLPAVYADNVETLKALIQAPFFGLVPYCPGLYKRLPLPPAIGLLFARSLADGLSAWWNRP